MFDRNNYEDRLSKMLGKGKARLAAIRVKVNKTANGLKNEYNEIVENLQNKFDEAEEKLQALKMSDTQEWKEFKTNAEDAINEAEIAFKDAVKLFEQLKK